jgi:hypothetical protein
MMGENGVMISAGWIFRIYGVLFPGTLLLLTIRLR